LNGGDLFQLSVDASKQLEKPDAKVTRCAAVASPCLVDDALRDKLSH
jgi:hypothetical protein